MRLENLQVRRPFRINARPEMGAATSVLGMATQYFCTPPNPQLDKYWDTVADRLFKIRNCMNIQGIVRQLPLFEPPIDPGLLVRAAAAGVDLGSVIASLNAPPPHYRFRFLLARAIALAEQIRTFGAMTLKVLERRDAEGLATLRASNESLLLDAVRDIKKKQVRQVEEALAQLSRSAALLSRLSERYRLGIVSNFYGNLRAVCEEVGLAPSIGAAIDSTVVGCKKPDARIFRAALDALGAEPAEAVFVGDSPSRDMAGARALGMRHVWLRPEGAPGNGLCCPGDVVIRRLAELERVSL